jgi:hypothetical protein
MTSLVFTSISGRDVVARIRCCGNTKASWLLSWRSGLPFWVPGALSLGGSQYITLSQSLHAHLIPSIITTQMVQLLEKRLTSSRLRTKVHQSQRRDTTKIRPSQPPSAFSKIKPFFTMLGRFAGRPAAPQNSSANPSGRVAGTFRITIGGMVHPVSNLASKPSQIVQHFFLSLLHYHWREK